MSQQSTKNKGYLEALEDTLSSNDLYVQYGILLNKKIIKFNLTDLENEPKLKSIINKHKHFLKSNNYLDW